MKTLIKISITFLLLTTLHSLKNTKRLKSMHKTPLPVSLWHRFECHTNDDCSKVKFCRRWRCVPRHKGFCTHDSECQRRQRCDSLRNKCVKRTWCEDGSTCDVGECCARIDPKALGMCHPLTQPNQFCLRKTTLCPCVKGYKCKPTSTILGYCAPEQ